MKKIDAHIHCTADHPDCIPLFDELELKLFNVCVAHDTQGKWRTRAEAYRQLTESDPDHFAWCTSFDPPDCTNAGFADTDYADRVIAELERDVAAGAVGCKIWKNVGMEIKKSSGDFLMVDDPIFDPVYLYLQKSGITLLAHIGEPLACWQPLKDDSPHYGYYNAHPEWHVYGRPDFPSHQQIIVARDHMLEKFPDLQVVGAHLGSLEYDVAEVAARLDRYPNFAVDTSARMRDLTYQDTTKVRQFFADYPGRILFGTDIVMRKPFSTMTAEERRKGIEDFRRHYSPEIAYYESAQVVRINERQVQGLGLSERILASFYHGNATRLYPGI
jgi:predicted TIM-barrel fold metal-dependent hydrolase